MKDELENGMVSSRIEDKINAPLELIIEILTDNELRFQWDSIFYQYEFYDVITQHIKVL